MSGHPVWRFECYHADVFGTRAIFRSVLGRGWLEVRFVSVSGQVI